MTASTAPQRAPYGTWKSPITAAATAESAVRLGGVAVDGADVYWLELRPTEGGRSVLVRRSPDGAIRDVTPARFNVRSLVHEYGGGAFAVADGVVYFSNFADQRLYMLPRDGNPRPLTPDLPGRVLRYADGVIDRERALWIGVREDHRAGGGSATVNNAIVAVPIGGAGMFAAGSAAPRQFEGRVLASGHDFYAAPRLNPAGDELAWLAWRFPNMPWDGTELWLADLRPDGTLRNPRIVAGGPDESIAVPEWSPDGVLHFASDRTDFWNLYRLAPGGEVEPICPLAAEFAGPMWGLGGRFFGFARPDSRDQGDEPATGDGGRPSPTWIVCGYRQGGSAHLGRIAFPAREGAGDGAGEAAGEQGELEPFDLPYREIDSVRVSDTHAVMVAGAPDQPTAIVEVELAGGHAEVLRSAADPARLPDPAYLSVPRVVSFPSEGGRTAHGVYYPPNNRDYRGPEGELPPLLVKSHGGPTGAARLSMSLGIQFWTSRGFAVLDVDYGGSTGYGRAYRNLLRGQWGVVDVEDCAAGARWLVEQGLVDGDRLAIDGGSAGGFTTLCALTFRDEFKAGASYFGVSDLGALAEETHKFESRYLDLLVGDYPAQKALYEARSPIHHVDRLACPVIFLQGLEDAVVPPAQSERMADALRKKGIPVAYLPFEGEQHGFRKAENITRALEAELYFYGVVFGFTPADDIEPVAIDNAGAVAGR